MAPTVLLMVVATGATPATLSEAFRREIHALNGEKAALIEAIAESKQTADLAKEALTRDIERQTAELTRLRAANTLSSQRLPARERSRAGAAQERQIEQFQEHIASWLRTRGVEEQTSIDQTIARAIAYLERRGGLRVVPDQTYFDANGLGRRGAVLRIAEVGAVTLGDACRPLARLEDGSLGVVATSAKSTLRAGVREIDVVLFDSTAAPTGIADHESWKTWMNKGGPFMWAIALLGGCAALLLLERGVRLILARIHVGRCRRILQATHGWPMPAPVLARVHPNDPLLSPVRIILTAPDRSPAWLEERAAETLMHAHAILVRGVSLLGIAASVAPLLGLLGTVTGMIGTFAVIQTAGTGDPRLLSGGISEALLTTQFGLMVAIPALLGQTALRGGADAIAAGVEQIVRDLLQRRDLPALPETSRKRKPAVAHA